MEKNKIIEAVQELDNWELIYVLEELSKEYLEDFQKREIKIDKHAISNMRKALIDAIQEDLIEHALLSRHINEAEENAKMGQAGIETLLIGLCVKVFWKMLARKKRNKEKDDTLQKILNEFTDDED